MRCMYVCICMYMTHIMFVFVMGVITVSNVGLYVCVYVCICVCMCDIYICMRACGATHEHVSMHVCNVCVQRVDVM